MHVNFNPELYLLYLYTIVIEVLSVYTVKNGTTEAHGQATEPTRAREQRVPTWRHGTHGAW